MQVVPVNVLTFKIEHGQLFYLVLLSDYCKVSTLTIYPETI